MTKKPTIRRAAPPNDDIPFDETDGQRAQRFARERDAAEAKASRYRHRLIVLREELEQEKELSRHAHDAALDAVMQLEALESVPHVTQHKLRHAILALRAGKPT